MVRPACRTVRARLLDVVDRSARSLLDGFRRSGRAQHEEETQDGGRKLAGGSGWRLSRGSFGRVAGLTSPAAVDDLARVEVHHETPRLHDACLLPRSLDADREDVGPLAGLHLGDSTWGQRPGRTCFVVDQDVVTDAQRVPLEPVHVRAPEVQAPSPNESSEFEDHSSLAWISGGVAFIIGSISLRGFRWRAS